MSDLEIFNYEQGTPEWFACRAGIPTASEFDAVMARGKGGAESKTRKTYLYKLAGEILTGEPGQVWAGNAHTARGHAMEPDARNLYALLKDTEPTTVGFLRRGRVGCSPDSLIGDVGLLEIKTKLPYLLLDVLDADEVPSEHMPQLQGQLWISGRQWVDFLAYWPGLPPFIKRVYRDESYIADVAGKVAAFLYDLDAVVARFSAMKEAA